MNKGKKMNRTITYRNTKQRQRMLEILCQTVSHPTAIWLYDELKPEFPSLSLGTVYRNLGILEDQGLLNRITSGSTFDRFDGNMKPHAHFRCTDCGNLYDMKKVDPSAFLQEINKNCGHYIEDFVIEYCGICESCSNKREKNKSEEHAH